MNPQIYATLERMKESRKPLAMDDFAIQRNLSIDMGDLLVLLAEEAELQSKKAEKQTEKVIKLTKALQVLTYVLIAIGIIQIIPALKSLF
jgi:hypothetical protein